MNTTNEVNTATQDTYKSQQEGVWIELSQIDVQECARVHTSEDIDSRAADMAKNGQLQNIVVTRKTDGRYELVIGNGRLESARKLGWEKIRADVKEKLTESQKLLLMLAENNEREDASPFYTALLYQRIKDTEHLELPELAVRVGKDRSVVGKYLSLIQVSPEVWKSGHACPVGLRQCLAIAKLTKVEDQLQVMKECAEQDLSGKALEARVKKLLTPAPAGAAPKPEKPQGPFQFIWKGNVLVIKGRVFSPHTECISQYTTELTDAYDRFMEEEKTQAQKAA